MSPKTAAEDNTGFKKNITASPSGKYSVIYHLQAISWKQVNNSKTCGSQIVIALTFTFARGR